MGIGSTWHWLILLVVVLVIFGTKKLRNIGSDLGGAVKGFKDSMSEETTAGAKKEEAAQLEATTVERSAEAETEKKNVDA